MAYFDYKGSKYGEKPVLVKMTIGNTKTVYVGGWIHAEDGNLADAAAATELLMGVVHEFTTKDGIILSEADSGEYTGTLTAQSGATSEKYLSAGTNSTVDRIQVSINIDPLAIYSNTPNATIGTTTGSDSAGYFCDLITSVQANESDAVTTAQQLAIHGTDPAASSKGLYTKYESQI